MMDRFILGIVNRLSFKVSLVPKHINEPFKGVVDD